MPTGTRPPTDTLAYPGCSSSAWPFPWPHTLGVDLVLTLGASPFPSYEISPLMVIHREERQSFAHFLTSTCAIVGGVLTGTILLRNWSTLGRLADSALCPPQSPVSSTRSS